MAVQVIDVQTDELEPMERVLSLSGVSALTSLSKSSIYRLIHDSGFPRALKIGNRQKRWRERDVLEWLRNRELAPRGGFAHEGVGGKQG